ncbi:MAG: hydrogenase iron-sulfur subunit [Archaeoglobaceae archaeon]
MSEDQKKTIIIDYKKCVSCGICVALCPHKVLEFVNGYPEVTGICKVCGLCAGSCITSAITMFAAKFRDDSILAEIEKSNLISCRRKSKEGTTLLCISRLDMIHIAEAIAKHGSVAILSCEGDCRNNPGAFEARNKVKVMRMALKKLGLEEERIAFNETPKKFEKISSEIAEILRAVARDRNVRALTAKMRTIVELGNVYGEKIDAEKYEEVLSNAVETAIRVAKILSYVKGEARVSEIAEKSGMNKRDVVATIVEMKRRGLVEIGGEDELTIRVVR